MFDKYEVFNSYHIKIIAMILMTVDHIGYIFELDIIYRIIGRLSFPLFAFLIYQGFKYTKNRDKYLLRLFIFGVGIELMIFIIGLYLPIYGLPKNIFLTLSFGLLALMIIDTKQNVLIKLTLILWILYISEVIGFDYGWYGIILIMSFYFLSINILITLFIQIVINMVEFYYFNDLIQYYSLISWIILIGYTGLKGRNIKHKYLFYLYYPFHIAFLYILNVTLFG